MQKLFSSEELRVEDRYRRWLEFSDARFMPMVYTRTDEDVFDASAQGVDIGDLSITRSSFNALILETNHETIRHHLNNPDVLGFSIKFSGECIVSQYDRAFSQGDGDISIVDANEPFKFVHLDKTDHLIIQIPRDRIEKVLGPARNFAAIDTKGSVAASLLRSFFRDLLRLQSAMQTDTLKRMSSVAIDLIIASIAECMAQATPKSIRGTIFMQRAKYYIEANLGKVDLVPSDVAAAVGVSLRQLQILFNNHGHQIGDWLWRRRLQVAADRLVDPAFVHLPIGTIAYGCGFASQAHFSRRFRDHFDVRPSDYRRLALAAPRGRDACETVA